MLKKVLSITLIVYNFSCIAMNDPVYPASDFTKLISEKTDWYILYTGHLNNNTEIHCKYFTAGPFKEKYHCWQNWKDSNGKVELTLPLHKSYFEYIQNIYETLKEN